MKQDPAAALGICFDGLDLSSRLLVEDLVEDLEQHCSSA